LLRKEQWVEICHTVLETKHVFFSSTKLGSFYLYNMGNYSQTKHFSPQYDFKIRFTIILLLRNQISLLCLEVRHY